MSRAIAESVILSLLLASQPSYATIKRDHKAIAAFKRSNPCPSTGATRGACPGHHVDHRTPLCAGGFDRPDNFQWLTVEEHRHKTRADLIVCAKLRALDRRQ